MRVLLTGGAGSIGVHFIAHFMHNTDWDIVCVDSFRHKGEFDRLTTLLEDHPDWRSRVSVFTHDLIAPFTSREVDNLGVIDIIINLASLSDVQASIDDPVQFMRNNHEIMVNTLEYARQVNPDVFLHFSTDEVYGPAEAEEGHPEWDVILPSNPYAASKAAQEAYAIAYWRSYGVPVIITNTMNNFGEMQQSSKYPVIIQKKVEAGEKVTVHAASDGQIGTRYYLHSRNAADAVLHILKNLPPYIHKPGQVDRPDRYNIVGSRQLSNLELAQEIADIMGKPLDYELVDFHSKQPGHDLHYGLDGGKLHDSGWSEPVNFHDSLSSTVKWQQEHSEWIS